MQINKEALQNAGSIEPMNIIMKAFYACSGDANWISDRESKIIAALLFVLVLKRDIGLFVDAKYLEKIQEELEKDSSKWKSIYEKFEKKEFSVKEIAKYWDYDKLIALHTVAKHLFKNEDFKKQFEAHEIYNFYHDRVEAAHLDPLELLLKQESREDIEKAIKASFLNDTEMVGKIDGYLEKNRTSIEKDALKIKKLRDESYQMIALADIYVNKGLYVKETKEEHERFVLAAKIIRRRLSLLKGEIEKEIPAEPFMEAMEVLIVNLSRTIEEYTSHITLGYKYIDKNKKFWLYGCVNKDECTETAAIYSIELKKAKDFLTFLNSNKNPYAKEIEESLESISEMKDGSGELLTGYLDVDKFYKMLDVGCGKNCVIDEIKSQAKNWKEKGVNMILFDGFIDYSTWK